MLTYLGFGLRCVSVVKTLFSYAFAFVSINNTLSPHIHLHKSIKQGCPLAPYLYVLNVDALGYLLETTNQQAHIRGVTQRLLSS